jgi:nitrite reductase (NADH) large subunit
VTSTKLKVTGIDLFSAGDFMGGPSMSTRSCFNDRGRRRVQEALWSRTTTLVGAVLYGDTADGAWYFQLLKDRPEHR